MGVSHAGGIQLMRLSIRLIFNFMVHVQFHVHVQAMAGEFRFSKDAVKYLHTLVLISLTFYTTKLDILGQSTRFRMELICLNSHIDPWSNETTVSLLLN